MTILYFTATGNSLQAAKALGEAKLLSIPQLMRGPAPEIEDDAVGLVVPCYSGGPPLMVRRFLAGARITAGYAFAVTTYGDMLAAAPLVLERYAGENGLKLDYSGAVWMTDSYLPMYEMGAQAAKLPEKRVEERLDELRRDIAARRARKPQAGLMSRLLGAAMQRSAPKLTGGAVDSRLRVDNACTLCGTCRQVCPAANIDLAGGSVRYLHHCEGCLACVHHCPACAIHMHGEKSAARFRNPTVSLEEIIAANRAGAQRA